MCWARNSATAAHLFHLPRQHEVLERGAGFRLKNESRSDGKLGGLDRNEVRAETQQHVERGVVLCLRGVLRPILTVALRQVERRLEISDAQSGRLDGRVP